MRVTPDRLDVAEAALEAYAEHLMQYGRAALPPRNDLRRVIEALPERSDAMSDPIKAYARAVAEATRKYLYVTQTADVPMLDEHDLQAIIATVPAPVMQPELTERDLREIAELKLVTTAIYAKHKVPPPDTTEPAPVATPTPDLDPEEVRRALGEYFSGKQYSEFAVDKIVAAAREWLRLREQPAPDVRPKWCNVHQHHKWCEHNGGVMGPTGYAAPDEQAQIDAAVAREREECARVAEWVWDSGNHGAHGGEQANRTTAAIRARSAKGA